MTDEGRRRIPIVDRRVAHQPTSGSSPGVAASPTGGQPPRPAGSGAMPPYNDASHPAPSEQPVDAKDEPLIVPDDKTPVVGRAEGVEEQSDFLDDLKRLQADFDNYRKRMMREQAATSTRAKARLIEQLLPVLDDFERALEHEDSSATELIYKQLRSTLEGEGLEEIPAEGEPFDPNVHDAIDSREEPGVSEIVVQSVYRRGYKVGEQVLRAAMVVVARPPEQDESQNENVAGTEPAVEE